MFVPKYEGNLENLDTGDAWMGGKLATPHENGSDIII
jgi:hypothetical protein